jgi:hypothetical protein
MSNKSEQPGSVAAEVEVTNSSTHGFWLYLGGRELFVSFDDFPWFAEAPVSKITRVEWPSEDHLSIGRRWISTCLSGRFCIPRSSAEACVGGTGLRLVG